MGTFAEARQQMEDVMDVRGSGQHLAGLVPGAKL